MNRSITQLLSRENKAEIDRIVKTLLRVPLDEDPDHPALQLRYMIDDYEELIELNERRFQK